MTNPDDGQILEPFLDKEGHPSVILVKEGRVEQKRVCDLVALTFLGPCPDGLGVKHRDGNKLNTAAANLFYG